MPAGRPTDYTPEIAQTICGQMIEGLSLREICRAEDMPARSTVHLWLNKFEEFSDQYARAMDLRCDFWADEILEISDDGTNDWVERKLKDGSTKIVFDGEHVMRSKLRSDNRKWLMSKMVPKKWGDKTALTGPDGGPLQTQAIPFFDPAKLSDEELDDFERLLEKSQPIAGDQAREGPAPSA